VQTSLQKKKEKKYCSYGGKCCRYSNSSNNDNNSKLARYDGPKGKCKKMHTGEKAKGKDRLIKLFALFLMKE